MMSGGKGVDDTVLVGFENESEEGTLNGKRSGIGGSRSEDLLSDREKKWKKVSCQLNKVVAGFVSVSESVEAIFDSQSREK